MEGSVLSEEDLERVQAGRARAALLLTDKLAPDHETEDLNSLFSGEWWGGETGRDDVAVGARARAFLAPVNVFHRAPREP